MSEYRYLIDETEPRPVGVSAITARDSLGYYVILQPERDRDAPDRGSGLLTEDTQHTLELKIRRRIEPPAGALRVTREDLGGIESVDEELTVTNYSNQPTAFELRLLVAGDFRGLPELRGQPLNLGHVDRSWDPARRELRFDWRAHHAFNHGSETGSADDWRAVTLAVVDADGPVTGTSKELRFPIALRPGDRWTGHLRITPFVPAVLARSQTGSRVSRGPRRSGRHRGCGGRRGDSQAAG